MLVLQLSRSCRGVSTWKDVQEIPKYCQKLPKFAKNCQKNVKKWPKYRQNVKNRPKITIFWLYWCCIGMSQGGDSRSRIISMLAMLVLVGIEGMLVLAMLVFQLSRSCRGVSPGRMSKKCQKIAKKYQNLPKIA